MPDSFELPRVRRAIVPLVRGERLAGFSRRVVNKLVALALGHTLWGSCRFAGRCAGLVPGLAAVIRALDDLSKPTARLRGIEPIRINRRSLEVINFPSGKERTTDVPLLSLCVRRQNKRALACANEYSYSAHNLLLLNVVILAQIFLKISGQARDLFYLPYLDGSDARPRDPSSDADGIVEILGTDQEVAGDLLAGLHERTVGYKLFTVADSNDGGR